MKRQFIPLKELDIYDEFHYQSGDSFEVNQKLDGNDTEHHKQGIEKIKAVLLGGEKVRPILAVRAGDRFKLLDGFKRSRAHLETGFGLIEAFVCEAIDPRGIDPDFKEMRCCKGGQPKEGFGLQEGNSKKEEILYWSGDPQKLRIEVAESIHVHWGNFGKYRLSLSKEEFKELANAILWEK